MEELITVLQQWGIVGLIIAAFTESFISPILPDLILVPLALANPENAIYYGIVATAASVLGGGIGYLIGAKLGVKAAKRMIPEKYLAIIQKYVNDNAAWAIFLAALSPIPYKFISITAGALRIPWPLFMAISLIGRGKRFLVEGVLIYYFGPAAIKLLSQYSDGVMIASLALIAVVAGVFYVMNLRRKKVVE